MKLVWKRIFLIGLIAGTGGVLWALNHMVTFLDAPSQWLPIAISALGFGLFFAAKFHLDSKV